MKTHRPLRNARGISLAEMMISVIVLAFSMAIVSQLAIFTTIGTVKTNSRVGGIAAARQALTRINGDIRAARGFGDLYGVDAQRLNFPAPQNPIYGTSGLPANQPAPPWKPIQLSPTCLIIQVPILYQDPLNDPSSTQFNPQAAENPRNGFPIMLKKSLPPSPPSDMENLDTIVYQVVPDSAHAGEFLIQMMRFSGAQYTGLGTSYMPAVTSPQTILQGIVGPNSVGGTGLELPLVFSYYGRDPVKKGNGKIGKLAATASNIENILGVGIDVDVKRTDLLSANSATQQPTFYGIHNETFMRSNRNVVINNFSR